MKKKLTIFFVCLLMAAVSFTGCSAGQNPGNQQSEATASVTGHKLTIVTSFYPMYIATINIAKDIPGTAVVNMTKPQTGCLHDYQLTPEDIKTLESAQVFVVNGAGMEVFLSKVVSQLPDLRIVEASKGIELIKGAGEEGDNPHVWVSITLNIQQVRNISEALCAIDPGNAEKYRSNAGEYIKKLEAEKAKMHEVLDKVENRNIITFHEAFPYFAQEFNLNIAAVIEREPGSEPSAGELADTIKIVKEAKVKALFAEPQYPTKAADTIARETGARVYTLDPGVTGPYDPDAYLSIMDENLKVLGEALK